MFDEKRSTGRDFLGRIFADIELEKKMKDKLLKMQVNLITFLRKEDGLTTVEYAVAGALIAAATVTAFFNLGGTVTNTITGIDAAIQGG